MPRSTTEEDNKSSKGHGHDSAGVGYRLDSCADLYDGKIVVGGRGQVDTDGLAFFFRVPGVGTLTLMRGGTIVGKYR